MSGKQKQQEPEIKKRLEHYASVQNQSPTLEQISEKLKRAEMKRKQTMVQLSSPRIIERRKNAIAKKKQFDQEKLNHSKEKVEKELSQADEKRRLSREQMRQKLRNHIAKVEEIRKEQATKRKESTENLKSQIDQKLDQAAQNRD